MLTFEQIKKEYKADEFSRNPRATLVEYLQYELLDSIFKQKNSEHLSFIGGTAIRLIYGSERFSEDLDFDNFKLDFSEFASLIDLVMADLKLKDFEVEMRMIEKMAYHCYIKFPDILFNNKLSGFEDEKLLIRIDAVRKERSIEPTVTILDRFSVYRKILVNPIDIILSQKIMAILGRKREKGRDLYDVSYLLGISPPNYEYLEKSCGINKAQLKGKLLERIAGFDLSQMAKDVAPFILKSDDLDRVLTFNEYILQKL